ncbi:MAG: hypothetical protein EA397_11715 [Deltaproteobacteria bacterium]|nr:MAG: hypothetical protein EA397_11715 [Deltaproteobacteria bacterium]
MASSRPYRTHPDAETLDLAFVQDFLPRYLDAWNQRTPESLLALADPQVLWEDPSIRPGGRAEGHEAVRAWLQGFWATFPDMTFDHLDEGSPASAALSLDAKTLIALWRCEGTWSGALEPPGFRPNGRRVRLVGVDLYGFRGGRLISVRTVVDSQDALIQLGLLPSPESRWLRGIARIQRALRRGGSPG